MRAGLHDSIAFLRAWRSSACRACRHLPAVHLALPVIWGCLDALVLPLLAPAGFLASVLFLSPRPGPRLAWQSAIFVLWSAWIGLGGTHRAFPGPEDGPRRISGEVRGFPSGGGRTVFALDTESGRARVQIPEPPFPILPGQRLEALGRCRVPEGPTNPGQFNQQGFLRSQGVDLLFEAESLRLLEPPGAFPRLVASIRGTLERALERTVPAAQLPMFQAALLGNTSGLDPAVMDDFRNSGMLHILAISGQHVGIFALILLQGFGLLRLPRKAAFASTGLLVALYVPISGGSISVVRSAIMFFCMLPAVIWERPGRGINNLALAACVCLAWMPYQILNLGCLLSFTATYFLILYSRPISAGLARMRPRGAWGAALGYAWPNAALSAVIFLGLFPLLSSTVHAVSPTSIAGNLATVGLSTFMLVAGVLALLASPSALMGGCLGESAGLLAAALAQSIKVLARLPGSCLPSASLPPAWGLLLLLLLLIFPFALRRGRGRLILLIGLAAFSGRWAALEAWDLARRPATVAFLDIGQGDATVLSLPGAVILVDAGPSDAGRKAILPWLRQAGIGRIDLAVVTHPDLDHYGGLAWLAERIPIGAAVHAGDRADTRAWRELEAALSARGVPWRAARAGQYLYRYGDFRLEVLAPEGPGQFRGRNDNSLVTLLRLGGDRILLTGDMEKESQAWLLRHGPADMRGAILKVPHHGSDRTTDLAFLAELDPQAAVISAGRRNRFGHPGPENLATLRAGGSRILLTPAHGAVEWRRDRLGAAWSTFLPEGRSPGSPAAAERGRSVSRSGSANM